MKAAAELAKTIVHTKAEACVCTASVMVYAPCLPRSFRSKKEANYRIIDPSDQSCKKQAADAKGDVIDFSEETAAMESVKTSVRLKSSCSR